MVCYICHCISLHVWLGENFILDSLLAILGGWGRLGGGGGDGGEETVLLAFCL